MKQIHEQHCNCVKKIESTFNQPQIVLLHLLRYIKRSSTFDIINYYFLDIINFYNILHHLYRKSITNEKNVLEM